MAKIDETEVALNATVIVTFTLDNHIYKIDLQKLMKLLRIDITDDEIKIAIKELLSRE